MRKLRIAVLAGPLLLALTACPPTPPITLSDFWTGTTHSTVWGEFAVPFPGTPPACDINVPSPFQPTGWWALNPAITPSSDTVGFTVWSDPACSRSLQAVYRSAMIIDLTPFYPRLSIPVGSTTPQGGRISKATLQFNVVPAAFSNPPGFAACSSYIGSVGAVSVLKRGAAVAEGSNTIPIGARLIQADPGIPVNPVTVIGAFPAVEHQIVDLSLVSGPGTFGNGTAAIVDTGPGVHAVTVDVTRSVVDAVNLMLPSIGFTVASVGENPISPSTPAPIACRTWVQPTIFDIKFL